MDQEQLREFEESLRNINAMMSALGTSQGNLASSTNTLTRVQQAKAKADEAAATAKENVTKATNQARTAMGSMTTAVLSTERNFQKYGSSVSQAGDAALSLGKAFGPLGTAIGRVAQALSFLLEKSMEQADNLVSATDQLRRMGDIGSQTSEEFLKLAHASGITSKNLALLVAPMQSLESGLVSLGSTTADGVKRFSELTEVTAEQRQQFRRMGIDQEELISSQAAYLQLQNATGRRMQENMRSTDQLQKSSLEYTRNLSELAALTGKDIDQIKKEQQAVLAREEFMIRNSQIERQIISLKESGRDDEAAQLEKELKVRDKFVTEISTRIGDTTLDTAVMQMITSGGAVFTEETAALARSLGMADETFDRFLSGIKVGDESIIDEFLQTFKRAQENTIDQLADAAVLGGEGVRRAFLLSGETITFAARRAGEDEVTARTKTQERIRDAMEKGFDPTMDARAALTELEIDASVALDNLLAKVNPLIGGFGGLTIAVGAATAALAVMAGTAAIGGMSGMGKAAGTAVASTRAAAARITPTSALRVMGGAGVMAAGLGVYGAIGEGTERSKEIDNQLASGQISEEDAVSARKSSTATTVGQSTGAAAGAVAGAGGGGLLGAKIGFAAGGPIGSAIGGFIGAGLGAWYASREGAEFGKGLGNLIGQSIDLESTEKQVKNLSNEIAIMQHEGASDEAIKLKQEELEITNSLIAATKEGDDHAAAVFNTTLEMLQAKKSNNEQEYAHLSTIQEMQIQALEQSKLIAKTEREIAALEGLDQEQISRTQAILDQHKEHLTVLDNKAIASKKLFDLDKQISNLRDSGSVDPAEMKLLEYQRDLRNEIVESYQKETSIDIEKREKNQGILDSLETQVKLTKEISELEDKISNAGFFGRSYDLRRELSVKQQELEDISISGQTNAVDVGSLITDKSTAMVEPNLQAFGGGIFSGPNTGYPVQLHGTELVSPLDVNSVLMELAKTPSSEAEMATPADVTNTTNMNNDSTEVLERSIAVNTDMMQMLSVKLDAMINALQVGNDVSDQILKQSL